MNIENQTDIHKAFAAVAIVGYGLKVDDMGNFSIIDPETGGAIATLLDAGEAIEWCADLPAIMSEEGAERAAEAEIERLAEGEDEDELV